MADDGTPRRTIWVFCRTGAVPEPGAVAVALRERGHTAEVTSERRWGTSVATYELAVEPRGTRVLVRIGDDLTQGPDVAASDRELVVDALGESAAGGIRRIVRVGHWDHADGATVASLVALLCERMGGSVVSLDDADDGERRGSDTPPAAAEAS